MEEKINVIPCFPSKLSSTARISLTVFKEQFRKKTLPELE